MPLPHCRIVAHQTPRWFDLNQLARLSLIRRIEFYQTTGSTNDIALQLGRDDNLNSPLLVIAEEQAGGRGRGSNRWWAKDGSLTFSLLIEPPAFNIQANQWPLISLTTAIAVADTLGHCAGGCPIGLKWPNDLQLNHKKVCGILVETVKSRSDRIVIGIGLNVRNSFADAPFELRQIATSIVDETGFEWGLTEVLGQLLQALEDRLHELGAGELPLQATWERHCVLTGKNVSLEVADRRVAGRCRGINEHGALLLETNGDVQAWFGGIVRLE